VTLQVYQVEDRKPVSVEIPSLDGKIATSFSIQREGNLIHVQRLGPAKAWNVLLVGMDRVEAAENAEIEVVSSSTLIKVKSETSSLSIHLR
jgi:hypothetical protein